MPTEAAGQRLDQFLTRMLKTVSRKQVKQALDGGQVFVDGGVARKASQALAGGETLRITLPDLAEEAVAPLPEVLLCDGDLLALNKPAGMPSHPTGSGQLDALSWGAGWLLEQHGEQAQPVLLHRLDVDTSGVLLLARTSEANRMLARLFAERAMDKTYLALVAGQPPGEFVVDNHLRPGRRGRTQSVRSGGQRAITAIRTLAQGPGFALVEARPKTGRTHQIRVHLAESGYPLLGDELYGGPDGLAAVPGRLLRRHLLHARSLRFSHPRDQQPLVVAAPLPQDFLDLLALLSLPANLQF